MLTEQKLQEIKLLIEEYRALSDILNKNKFDFYMEAGVRLSYFIIPQSAEFAYKKLQEDFIDKHKGKLSKEFKGLLVKKLNDVTKKLIDCDVDVEDIDASMRGDEK